MSAGARHLVSPARGRGEPAGGGTEPRRVFYERIARVELRHTYYDAIGGACPDFDVRPTAWTAGLMRRLGLLFRAEPAGFSVLFNRLRAAQLLAFVDRDREGGQPWTRLCFVLSLRTPWFVNFTELPVDTNPVRRNVYLTNRNAHVGGGGEVLLPLGDRVDAADLVPVTGGQFAEPVPPGVRCVRVLSVSGEEVVCRPRCVTAEAAARTTPDRFGCADMAPPGTGICSDRLYFDLAALPEELYDVQTVWENGRVDTAEYLYTAAYPIPLCFVELVLADPTGGGDPALYPVRDPGGPDGGIEAVDYVVPFRARATWWSYYVTATPPDDERGELRIRQVRREGERRVAFRGPCCVTLADGRPAWRFVSARPIPLEWRSPLHLQLVWRRAGDRHAAVLIDCLPVAGGRQVLPMEHDRACEQAWESLCAESPPGWRCRRLLGSLCRDGPGFGPERRIFSDIYVHV